MSDLEDTPTNDNVPLQRGDDTETTRVTSAPDLSRRNERKLSPVQSNGKGSRPSSSQISRPESKSLSEDGRESAPNSKPKKLPPIKKSKAKSEEDKENEGRRSSADSVASSIASSMAASSAPHSASRRPRILQYKRETTPDRKSAGSAGSQASPRAVSFAAKSKSPAPSEVTVRKKYDGSEVTMVTMETQTDWTMIESHSPMNLMQNDVPDDLAQSDEEFGSEILEANEETEYGPTPQTKTPSSSRGPRERTTSKTSQKSALLVSSSAALDDDLSPAPYPDISDQYGIPMLQLSSDSEDSSDDESPARPIEDNAQDGLLPSIGPPQILQYQRESEKKEDAITSHGLTEEEVDGGMFEGKCEFCEGAIKAFPTPEMQETMPPEALYCCNDYREFVEEALMHPLNQKHKEDKLINVKPHPAYGSKQDRRAAKERAAQRMRERELARQQKAAEAAAGQNAPAGFYAFARQMKTINFQLSSQKCLDEGWTVRPPSPLKAEPETEVFVPEPVLPPWVRQNTNLKRQATTLTKQSQEMLTERPLQRGASLLSKKSSDTLKVKQSSSRQTVTSKSDQKLSKKGKVSDMELAPVQSDDPAAAATEKGVWIFNKKKQVIELADPVKIDLGNEDDLAFAPVASWFADRPLVEKFYPNGNKFLTMFPDGTGNVFYPSGNIAIVVSSTDPGLYTYIVMDDAKENASILALFEPNGRGVCYHGNGVVRVLVDQIGGIELDELGARRRKWKWKEQISHVHAPPLQPLCFTVTRSISLRIIRQEHIILTLSTKQRSCRFSVGARLRVVAAENMPPIPVSEDQLFISQVKDNVQLILNRVSNLLKFPKSPKLEKIPTPLHLRTQLQRSAKMKTLKSAHV